MFSMQKIRDRLADWFLELPDDHPTIPELQNRLKLAEATTKAYDTALQEERKRCDAMADRCTAALLELGILRDRLEKGPHLAAIRNLIDRLRWDRWRDRDNGRWTDHYDIGGVEAERREAADELGILAHNYEDLRAISVTVRDIAELGRASEDGACSCSCSGYESIIESIDDFLEREKHHDKAA